MAQTLTEAVQDEQQQRGWNQTDQDHAQPQLTNHQQVNPQRQRAEVHLHTDTHDTPVSTADAHLTGVTGEELH